MSDSSDIVYCRVCAFALPAAARKCTKCDSWQKGLRSILPLTDASLSLLLALISVLTVVGPPMVKWLGRESLVDVAIGTAEKNDLKVAISNAGRRPTAFRSYRVDFIGADLLPAQTLAPRNTQNALLLPDNNATIQLCGALKIPLDDTRQNRDALAGWITSGTVRLTACVKEAGAGVTKANMLAPKGSCESEGLVTRTDSIAAVQLKEWIEGLVQWNPTTTQSASSDSQ